MLLKRGPFSDEAMTTSLILLGEVLEIASCLELSPLFLISFHFASYSELLSPTSSKFNPYDSDLLFINKKTSSVYSLHEVAPLQVTHSGTVCELPLFASCTLNLLEQKTAATVTSLKIYILLTQS